MPFLLSGGAMLQCSFGTAPARFNLPPMHGANADGQELANLNDRQPMAMVGPFGLCTTLSNPQVASATAAALGVLTPQPCVPVIPGPWAPPSTLVAVDGQPAVLVTATCTCAWGGAIQVAAPGQTLVDADP